jgi:hypothetical protein
VEKLQKLYSSLNLTYSREEISFSEIDGRLASQEFSYIPTYSKVHPYREGE